MGLSSTPKAAVSGIWSPVSGGQAAGLWSSVPVERERARSPVASRGRRSRRGVRWTVAVSGRSSRSRVGGAGFWSQVPVDRQLTESRRLFVGRQSAAGRDGAGVRLSVAVFGRQSRSLVDRPGLWSRVSVFGRPSVSGRRSRSPVFGGGRASAPPPGVRCPVSGVWSLVVSSWCPVWVVVSGVRCPVFGGWILKLTFFFSNDSTSLALPSSRSHRPR